MRGPLRIRYCRSCGVQLGDLDRFCDECGAALARAGDYSVTYGPVVAQNGVAPQRILGIIDDLVLLSVLGEGGMGIVYRALAAQSGQEFAVKTVRESLQLKTRSLVARLEAEAQRQSSVVDPNVVRVFRFISREQLAIVMELVEGPTLEIAAQQAGGVMPVPMAIHMGSQMARGLSVVHAHGYLHLDVKPSNFLVANIAGTRSRLKIADFGIARELAGAMSGEPRFAGGTPGYMSPEQILRGHLDARSDLYSLGCVLHELLSGRPVFETATTETLQAAHCGAPPTPLERIRPDIPVSLARLVDSLLSKNVGGRPSSAGAVYETLRAIEGGT